MTAPSTGLTRIWPGGTEAQSGPAWEAVRLAGKATDRWAPVEQEIRREFQPQLVAEKLQTRMSEYTPILAKAEAQLEEARQLARELETTMFKPAPPPDVVTELRRQEIRRWLLSLPREDRRGEVGMAEAGGDVEVVRAAYEAPRAFQLLTDEDRARLSQSFVIQAHPKKWAELQVLTQQVGLAEHIVEQARHRIHDSITMTPRAAAQRDELEAMGKRMQVA